MAGKVLVSTQEHIDRLIAARLQADIMKSNTVIVARTDAEAATLLDNNIDPRDHPFIIGSTCKSQLALNAELRAAELSGIAGTQLTDIMQAWDAKAGLCTYGELVAKNLSSAGAQASRIAEWNKKYPTLSHTDAVALAQSWNVDSYWLVSFILFC